MEKETLTRAWLIKELAQRARFTQSDVQIIWGTFEEIIKDIVYDKNELTIYGLFKMYISTIKAHDGWNANKSEKIAIPETKRICFKPSKILNNLLKDKEQEQE